MCARVCVFLLNKVGSSSFIQGDDRVRNAALWLQTDHGSIMCNVWQIQALCGPKKERKQHQE
ncbi:hypothetical protein M5D96_014036 [Drosophila gunungcola]|uniref:Uncharacterized protein n=1 Tax=Drosophila gunungcola TaxID=103775 RepID=A0A9Q0BI87_9MUSC|nr:hypothetical protein M5D96_014036 [Drosophila gunungcola]